MSGELVANVHLDGNAYGPSYPDVEITPDVARQITNPKAWAGGTVPTFEDDEPTEPRGNASAETWRAHAEGLGIEVPEGAGRDEIRALVDARHAEQD